MGKNTKNASTSTGAAVEADADSGSVENVAKAGEEPEAGDTQLATDILHSSDHEEIAEAVREGTVSSSQPPRALKQRTTSIAYKQYWEEHPEWARGQSTELPPGTVETYLDSQNITRSPDIVKIIAKAMGWNKEDTVVFTPKREALHLTIVALTIGVRFTDKNMLAELVNAVCIKRVLPQVIAWEKEQGNLSERLTKEIHANFIDVFNKDPVVLAVRERVDAYFSKQKEPASRQTKIDLAVAILVDNQLRQRVTNYVQSVIAQTIQEILAFKKEHRAGQRSETDCHNQDLVYLPFEELPTKANFERSTWLLVGGPAAGKSYLARNLEWDARKSFADISKINPDYYKDLLLPPENLAEDIRASHAAMTHEESSIVANKIKQCLREMIGMEPEQTSNGHSMPGKHHEPPLSIISFASLFGTLPRQVPDIMFDVVNPSKTNLAIASYGTIYLRVATCSPRIAMMRAHERAMHGSERGRFVPPPVLLDGHKKVSLNLPDAIANNTVFLEIYNTAVVSGASAELIADIRTLDKRLAIYSFTDWLAFMKRADINASARTEHEIEERPASIQRYVEHFGKYTQLGITFLFCAKSGVGGVYATLKRTTFAITDLASFLTQVGSAETAAGFVAAFATTVVENIPCSLYASFALSMARNIPFEENSLPMSNANDVACPRQIDIYPGPSMGKVFASNGESAEYGQGVDKGAFKVFFGYLRSLMNREPNRQTNASPEHCPSQPEFFVSPAAPSSLLTRKNSTPLGDEKARRKRTHTEMVEETQGARVKSL
jgi:hypothetical protein